MKMQRNSPVMNKKHNNNSNIPKTTILADIFTLLNQIANSVFLQRLMKQF